MNKTIENVYAKVLPARLVFITALIASVVLIYLPGLHGPFLLDDEPNIVANPSIALQALNVDSLLGAALANDSGILQRPLASLSFALNAYFAGGFSETAPFKLTNIIIHAFNSVLIYFLTLALLATPILHKRIAKLEAELIAVIVSVIWAVHPIQLTSVLYVVQRMNSLSALFVVAGLLGFVRGRQLYDTGRTAGLFVAVGSITLGTAAGLCAKENAALLPLFALVIEFCLFQRHNLAVRKRTMLYVVYGALILLPIAAAMLYIVMNPGFILQGYLGRDYGPLQRTLTETRVLWFYLSILLVPSPARMGLFHDDLPLSVSLLSPPITLVALVAWIALAVWSLAKFKKMPLLAFAVLWFLAGHAIESSFIGLEIAFEHRNYLPIFGPIFSGTVAASSFIRQQKTAIALPIIVITAIVLSLTFSTWNLANAWSDVRVLSSSYLRNHPQSPRTQDFAARVALRYNNDVISAINHALAGWRLRPNNAGIHIDLQILLTLLKDELAHNLKPTPETRDATVIIERLDPDIQVTRRNNQLFLDIKGIDSDKTTALLLNGPNSVHVLFSLERLQNCITIPPHVCQHLYKQAIRWHEAAIANSTTSKEDRAALYRNLALIYAQRRDFNRALESIREASRQHPAQLAYRLGEVEYLINTKQQEKARALLDTTTHNTPSRVLYTNRNAIEKLDFALKEKKLSAQPMRGLKHETQ